MADLFKPHALRRPQAVDLPLDRARRDLRHHRTEPGVSANCRRGNHATCYTVKCLCPCHNRDTGGVKPR